MGEQSIPHILTVVVLVVTVLNGWIMYHHSRRQQKHNQEAEQRKAEIEKLEDKITAEVTKVTHSHEMLDVRVDSLEKHSITEAKTKDLIDRAVEPLQKGVDEIRQNNKESQRDIKHILLVVSNLAGQLGIKMESMGKD